MLLCPFICLSARPFRMSVTLLPGYFSATSGKASLTKGGVHIITIFRFDDFSQSYCLFNFFTIWHRKMLSRLSLSNFCLEFNESLWEASITRGNVHIISMFWFDDFSQSYCPFNFCIICHRKILFRFCILMSGCI